MCLARLQKKFVQEFYDTNQMNSCMFRVIILMSKHSATRHLCGDIQSKVPLSIYMMWLACKCHQYLLGIQYIIYNCNYFGVDILLIIDTLAWLWRALYWQQIPWIYSIFAACGLSLKNRYHHGIINLHDCLREEVRLFSNDKLFSEWEWSAYSTHTSKPIHTWSGRND